MKTGDRFVPLENGWRLFDSGLKLMSGLLIFFSLVKFKRLLRKMRGPNKSFFANERLMTIHFGVFVLYIIGNFGEAIHPLIYLLNKNEWNAKYKEGDGSYLCRNMITHDVFTGLIISTNCVMLVLFTYLSVKFSEPLGDYRSSFLLLF